MAARWSNPSGSRGVHRFRVWPDDKDRYNHIELAQNWDKVDAMIGVNPDGTGWPPTTGINGGLYSVINTLQKSSIPIGMMFAWHRPSPAIPLPVGFAICDGTTLSASQHDFEGGGNIVLPDLRNRFIIGADVTKAIGTAGVDITHADINNPSGAPGPQGIGGSNTVTLSLSNLASHNHSAGGWTGWGTLNLINESYNFAHPKAGNYETVFIPGSPGGQPCHGQGGWMDGQHRHKLENINIEGSNQPHENRPAYFGMIWIMKVRNID